MMTLSNFEREILPDIHYELLSDSLFYLRKVSWDDIDNEMEGIRRSWMGTR